MGIICWIIPRIGSIYFDVLEVSGGSLKKVKKNYLLKKYSFKKFLNYWPWLTTFVHFFLAIIIDNSREAPFSIRVRLLRKVNFGESKLQWASLTDCFFLFWFNQALSFPNFASQV